MAIWEKVKIGDFLFERDGRYKPDSQELAGLQRIDKIDFSGNFHIANKPSKTDMILIKPGDLVISGINVAKGALGIFHGHEDVTATIHYSSYTFDESKVSVEYFKRFLKSALFVQLLTEQVKGGIKTEIKPKHLLPLEILLPDKQEQLTILKRFQLIENEDKELKNELTHQQSLLKKLRQQILQEAIEGKLSADWRAQNFDMEPANELLKRIAVEKAQLVKDKKIKAQKPLPPITDEEKPFELSRGWVWCNYGDTMLEIEAGSSPVCFNYPANIDEWGVLKISAISWDSFQENENKKLHPNTEPFIEKEIKSGDFIMTRANTKELVAKSVIVGNVRSKLLLNDKTLRVRFSAHIYNRFMNYFNNSEYSRLHYIRVSTGASPSMKNISRDNIKTLLLPLPSLGEQQIIVTKVEKLLALCDKLEIQITQNKTHAKQLMQAVLKEAFANKKAEPKKLSSIVPFKPKGSDYYKRTLLAAEIVDQLKSEPTLGHLKLQKLIYLCQKSENMQLPVNFLQQAAGPYDPQMARSLDKQLQDKGWFQFQKNEMLKYKPLPSAGTHKPDFQKYFSTVQTGIQTMIDLFRNTKSDHIEIVATLYACWEKMIENKETFSAETLIRQFYAWSKEKSRFSEEVLKNTILWMTDKDVFPKQI